MAIPKTRLAEPADIPAMSELLERQMRKYILRDCTREGQQQLLDSVMPAALQANLRAGFEYHVSATSAGLFGVVGMRLPSHIHHLFVADVMHRAGLGRHLWETARDAVCMQHSVPPVFTVNSSLYAVGFYRALGFEAVGEVDTRGGVRAQPMRYVMLGAMPK